MKQLAEKASALIGRDVEVERTKDGKYIVLFMSLSASPPPKGNTPEEALSKFIEWFEASKVEVLPDLDILEDDDGTDK